MKSLVVNHSIEFVTVLQTVIEYLKIDSVLELQFEQNIISPTVMDKNLLETIVLYLELLIYKNTRLLIRIDCQEFSNYSLLFLIFAISVTCSSKDTRFYYTPSMHFLPLNSLLFHSHSRRISPQIYSQLVIWKQQISTQEAINFGLVDGIISNTTKLDYPLESIPCNHSSLEFYLNQFKVNAGNYLLQQRKNYDTLVPCANTNIFSNENCVLVDEPLWKEFGIAHIEFNRPTTCNAINMEFTQQILAISQFLSSHSHLLRCILISGKGDHFCSGADVKWLQQVKTQELTLLELEALFFTYFKSVVTLRQEHSVPMIAVIHNRLIGGANSLAFLCDYIFASETTSFQFGILKRGFNPAFFLSQSLQQRIGNAVPMKLYLEDSVLTIQEAVLLQIVQQVIPNKSYDQIKQEAIAFCKQQFCNRHIEAIRESISLMRIEVDEEVIYKESIKFAENFARTTETTPFASTSPYLSFVKSTTDESTNQSYATSINLHFVATQPILQNLQNKFQIQINNPKTTAFTEIFFDSSEFELAKRNYYHQKIIYEGTDKQSSCVTCVEKITLFREKHNLDIFVKNIETFAKEQNIFAKFRVIRNEFKCNNENLYNFYIDTVTIDDFYSFDIATLQIIVNTTTNIHDESHLLFNNTWESSWQPYLSNSKVIQYILYKKPKLATELQKAGHIQSSLPFDLQFKTLNFSYYVLQRNHVLNHLAVLANSTNENYLTRITALNNLVEFLETVCLTDYSNSKIFIQFKHRLFESIRQVKEMNYIVEERTAQSTINSFKHFSFDQLTSFAKENSSYEAYLLAAFMVETNDVNFETEEMKTAVLRRLFENAVQLGDIGSYDKLQYLYQKEYNTISREYFQMMFHAEDARGLNGMYALEKTKYKKYYEEYPFYTRPDVTMEEFAARQSQLEKYVQNLEQIVYQ